MASNSTVKRLLVAIVVVACLQTSACSDSLCLGWMPDSFCDQMCFFTGFGVIGNCSDPSTTATSAENMAAPPPTDAAFGDMAAAPPSTAATSGDNMAAAAPPQPASSCFCCCSD